MVFNAGTLMGGFAGLAAALGVHRGLRSVGTGHVLAVLLALVVAANGVAFLFGGWFPLPDHRHTAYNLGLLVLLGAPRDLRRIIAFLIVNTVAGFALLAVMFGTGNLVTRANIRGLGAVTVASRECRSTRGVTTWSKGVTSRDGRGARSAWPPFMHVDLRAPHSSKE
jgi:hypothetical protein